LTENVQLLLLKQQKVERTISSVESYHAELSGTLDNLESNLEDLFRAQGHLSPQDGDIEREKAYQRAEDIKIRLDSMQSSLKDTVDDLNTNMERSVMQNDTSSGGSKGSDHLHILQILNSHHDTLAQLDSTRISLETDIGLIGRALSES